MLCIHSTSHDYEMVHSEVYLNKYVVSSVVLYTRLP